jgi:hypothetical protein
MQNLDESPDTINFISSSLIFKFRGGKGGERRENRWVKGGKKGGMEKTAEKNAGKDGKNSGKALLTKELLRDQP